MPSNFNTVGTINNIHGSVIDNLNNSTETINAESVFDYYNSVSKSRKAVDLQLSSLKNYSAVQAMLQDIEMLKVSPKVAGFDIETFGTISDPKMFMVSEMAIVERNLGGAAQVVQSYRGGIPKNKAEYSQIVISKYLQGDASLSPEVRESAKVGATRLPFVANPRKNRASRQIDNINVRPIMNDFQKFGPTYQGVQSTEEVTKLRGIIQGYIDNGVPIVGHNIKKADIPWANRLFTDHGLDPIDFSKGKVVDTLEMAQLSFGESLYDLFASADKTNISRGQSLGAFAKITGQKLNAHIAESDISANIDMLYSNIEGMGQTLLEAAEQSLKERISASGVDAVSAGMGNRVLYARKAMKKEHALDVLIDSDGKPATYRDYISTRGTFYEIGGYSFIPAEELSDDIRKTLPKGSTGMHSVTINSYGDGLVTHSVVINRGSLGGLSDAIGNSFSVYNLVDDVSEVSSNRTVTREFAKAQSSIYENDLARRSYEAMTDVGTDKGFNYAEKMYGSYDNAIKALGENATKSNLETLVKNGSIELDGNTFKLEDVLPGLSKEQSRDFVNMFNVIEDTKEVTHPMIELINKTSEEQMKLIPTNENLAKEYKRRGLFKGKSEDELIEVAKKERLKLVNEKKTEMLKNSINELENMAGHKIELKNGYIDNNIGYTNYGSIKINGEYFNIDISTRETAGESMFWSVRNSVGNVGSKMNQDAVRRANVKAIATDLYERGLISESEFSKFNNIGDANTSSKYLGGLLFDAKEKAIADAGSVENYIKNSIENIDSPNIINKVPASNFGTGARMGGLSVNEYVSQNGGAAIAKKYAGTPESFSGSMFIEEAVQEGINKSSIEFNLTNINGKKYENGQISNQYLRVKASISDYLKNNLNYEDMHIEAVADAIMNGKSSYISRGYNVSLASYTNNSGDIEHGIIAYTQQNEASVKKALANGELPEKAIIHPLVGINNRLDGNVMTVSRGLTEKRIVETIDSYVQDGNVKFKVGDTVTDSIKQPTMSYRVIDRMYSKGNYEGARRTAMKRAGKSIMDSSGVSAAQTVTLGGVARKEVVPRMADLVNVNYADGIISSVPQLYNKSEEFRNAIDTALGKDGAEDVIKKINKSIANGSVISFEKLNGSNLAFGEWFQTNLINGIGIAQKMIDSDVLPESVANTLQGYISDNPSQLLKEKLIGSHIAVANKIVPADLTPYGHLNNPRRPQHNQYLNSLPVFNQEIEEYAKKNGIDDIRGFFSSKKNASVGIALGDIVQTTKANEHYFKQMGIEYAERGGITLGVYGGVKQMSPADLQVELRNFDKEAFLKKFNAGKPVDQKATMKDVEDLIWQYGAGGGTNEQHSYIAPVVDKYLRFNDELKTINISEELINNFEEGSRIEKGAVLGYKTIDGKEVAIKYDGESGIIGSLDKEKGKAFVQLDNPAFEEKKYITGFFEKSVGSSIRVTTDGREVQDLSQSLFESIFGEGTIQVANFEYGKHETGSAIVGSNANIISEVIRNSDDTESVNKIIDIMNKRLDGWNVRLGEDSGNKVGNILLMDVSKRETNDIAAMKNLIGDIRDLSINGETEGLRKISKDIVDTIDHFNENNMLYLPVNASNLSEMVSYADDAGGKGVKQSLRTNQIFGGAYADGFRVVGNDGELSKVAQPILDEINRDIKGSRAYKSASRDVSNIIEASRLADGREAANPSRIKKMKLEDLPGLDRGNLNAQSLSDTIFGDLIDDFDVLEVDLGDITVKNPYTKEATNKVFIPLGGAHMISDDEIFFSKNMKLSNDLLMDLQRVKDLDFEDYGSLHNLKEKVDERVYDLYSNLDYEMNNKNGLVSKTMLSGRVRSSAAVVNGGIIDMHFMNESFDNATNTKILHQLSDQVIEIGPDGKPKYLDVAFVSKDVIGEIGIKDYEVAEQILKENLGGDDFRQSLIDKGLITNDGNYNILSEEDYYKQLTPYGEIEPRPEFTYEDFKANEAIPTPVREKPMSKKEFIDGDFGAYKYPDKPVYKELNNIDEFYNTKPKAISIKKYRDNYIEGYVQANKPRKNVSLETYGELRKGAENAWLEDGINQYKEYMNDYKIKKEKFYQELEHLKSQNQDILDYNRQLKANYNADKANVRQLNGRAYQRYRDSFNAFENHVPAEEVRVANKKIFEARKLEHEAKYQEWYEGLVKYNDDTSYKKYRTKELARLQTEIAEEYYQNKGLQGIVLRNPAFHEGSQQAALIKMHKGLKGNSVILSEGMAKRLNADVDGDGIFLNFLLGTDSNGKLKIRNNDEIDKSFRKMIDIQSELNAKEVASKPTTRVVTDSTGKIIDASTDLSESELQKVKGNFASNLDDYEVKLFDIYGEDIIKQNTNYLTKEKTIMTAIKARHNKSAIGPLSVQGFNLRNTLSGIKVTSQEDIQKLQNVLDFTRTAEQKIIDVKHDVDGLLTTAGTFGEAIQEMGTAGDNMEQLEKGFNKLHHAMINSTVYDKDVLESMPSAKDIISGNYDTSNQYANELRSVYEVFTSEEGKKAYNDVIAQGGHGGYTTIDSNKKILDTLERGVANSDVGSQKLKAISEAMDKTIIGNVTNSENSYSNAMFIKRGEMDGNFDIATIVDAGISKKDGVKYVTLQDSITDETFKVYGSSFKDIGEAISKEFSTIETNGSISNIVGVGSIIKEAKNAHILSEAKSTIYDTNRSFNNVVIADMVDNGGSIDINADGVIENIKSTVGKYGGSEVHVNNVIDELTSLSKMSDNQRSLRQSVYEVIAKNYDSVDRSIIAEASLKLDSSVANNELSRSQANEVMNSINEDIIVKGRKAKQRNALKKGQLDDMIAAKASEIMKGNDDTLSSIIDSINKNKMFNMADAHISHMAMKDNTLKALEEITGGKNSIVFNEHVDMLDNAINSSIDKIEAHNIDVIKKNDDLFQIAYNMEGGKEKVLNWKSYDSKKFDIMDIENSKIGFGAYGNLSIKDISLSELADIASDTSVDTDIAKASRDRIKDYLNAVNFDNYKESHPIFSRKTDISKITKSIDDSIDVNSINRAIIEKAKAKQKEIAESIGDMAEETISDAIDDIPKSSWYKNKYVIAAGVAATALGVMTASRQSERYLDAPGRVYTPNSELQEQPSQTVPFQAPDSPRANNRAMLQGLGVRVRGRSRREIDTAQMANSVAKAVGQSTGSDINVNTNEYDSRKPVSESWLKSKFAELIK